MPEYSNIDPTRLRDVTVVIPCFNAGSTLPAAVQSALNNDSVAEVIISDDGSKDDSAAISARLGNKVRFIEGKNGGAPSARNRGMRAAHTDFVHFLDSDDTIDAGYIDALRMHAGKADVVLGPYRRVSTDGTVFDESCYPAALASTRALAAYLKRPTQTGAFLWRRAFLESIGGWDETLAIYQDAELTFRALLATDAIAIAETDGLFAFWLDNESEFRLSRRFTPTKAESTLRALDRHKSAILDGHDSEVIEGLGMRYYSLARLSFRNDLESFGELALAGYRSLGQKGHLGSAFHRLASTMLGLGRKERISMRLAALRRG